MCLAEAVIPHQRQQTLCSSNPSSSSLKGAFSGDVGSSTLRSSEGEGVRAPHSFMEEIDRNRSPISELGSMVVESGSSSCLVIEEAVEADEDVGYIAPCGIRLSEKRKACKGCGGPCGGFCYSGKSEDYAADMFMKAAMDSKRRRTEEGTGSSASASVRVENHQRPSTAPPSTTNGRGKRRRLATMPLNFGKVPDWLGADPSIGGIRIHPSHQPHLGWHRGIVWCWRCGKYATRVPINLRKGCEGLTESGQKHLTQLRQGKPPSCKVSWPLPLV